MKFLICALLNMSNNKTLSMPNRQLFVGVPEQGPQQADANPEQDEQDEDAHLDRLAAASKESPLKLAAALEDSLVKLGEQSAERETEEIDHGRGELVATLTAMGATKEESAEALARYDEEFEDSGEKLTDANEDDREAWVQTLKKGALNVRGQKYEGDKAVMDERISSLDLALTSADRRIEGKRVEIRTAERAFGDAKSGLEAEAKNLFGGKVDYATLRDGTPEELSQKLADIFKKREEKGMVLPDYVYMEMAIRDVTGLKAKVEGIKAKETAVDSAKVAYGSEVERKGRLQDKKNVAMADRATMVEDYSKDMRAINDGTYVLPGGDQTLTETAYTIADNTFTPEELDLLHSYTAKSGEMVRTLTLEIVGKRIKEERDNLQDKLDGSEALVEVREGLLRSKVQLAEDSIRKAASDMGVSWKEVKNEDEQGVREKMAESIHEKSKKRYGSPYPTNIIEDMVADGYAKFAQKKADYEAAVYAQDNDSTLAAHRSLIAQYKQEIQTLDEYADRNFS